LPFGVLAARLGRARQPFSLGQAAALVVSFSAYYWTCVGFAFWRMGGGI